MITPADTPSNAAGFNGVAVSGFDIQAPQPDVAGPAAQAMSDSAMRQNGAEDNILDTPAGYSTPVHLGGTAPQWTDNAG